MSKNELLNLTVKELREIAKRYEISGRWDMTKEQLAEELSIRMQKEDEDPASWQDDPEETPAEETPTEETTEVTEIENYDADLRLRYVENAEVGTLVAFKLPNGKVKSAKISRKSTKRKMLRVITGYDVEYDIPYNDVIWVKYGKRWPKGVYSMLKGLVKADGSEARKSTASFER